MEKEGAGRRKDKAAWGWAAAWTRFMAVGHLRAPPACRAHRCCPPLTASGSDLVLSGRRKTESPTSPLERGGPGVLIRTTTASASTRLLGRPSLTHVDAHSHSHVCRPALLLLAGRSPRSRPSPAVAREVVNEGERTARVVRSVAPRPGDLLVWSDSLARRAVW